MARNSKLARGILIALLVICSIVLVLGVFALVMLLRNEAQIRANRVDATETEPIVQETTVPVTEVTEVAETIEETQPAEEAVPEQTAPQETQTEPEQPTQASSEPTQSELLAALLEKNQSSYGQLEELGCTQLITVLSEGTTASIRFYSYSDGAWQEQSQLSCQGFVGRSGVYADKQEGDGSTPSGLYKIGSGFYIHDAPQTGLDLFQITQETYWVDDPDSMFYNKRVEGTENKDWKSAEHMISYDVYRYGFVVDYNVAAEYKAGSAIFFHISDRPTAGCIATEENMVLSYLAQLDKTKNPYILIVCGDEPAI